MGGSKRRTGGDTVVTPVPMQQNTMSTIGNQLDAKPETLDESKRKEEAVDTRKLGTRGLRIPLTSDKSTPTSGNPAASLGIQI